MAATARLDTSLTDRYVMEPAHARLFGSDRLLWSSGSSLCMMGVLLSNLLRFDGRCLWNLLLPHAISREELHASAEEVVMMFSIQTGLSTTAETETHDV